MRSMHATMENVMKVIKSKDINIKNADALDPGIPFSDQNVDSLDQMSLIFRLEDEFHLKIPDEDVSRLNTINGIIEYLNQRLSV
jgi:acyl carrier protein